MNQPKPEHRISFLEKQFLALGGNIEGIKEDIETLDQGMKSSFDKIGDAFTLLDRNIETLKTTLETRLGKIEETQAEILKLLKEKGA